MLPIISIIPQPVAQAQPSGGLLLDDLSNAYAYSVRKLRTAYSGNSLRVRRASDNTEQDIGFSGNDLDTSALASFCSGTNGFVTTVYDQGTSSRHMTQTDTTKQPKIYDSVTGTLTLNSKAAMLYDNTNDTMQIATMSLMMNFSMATVIKPSTTSGLFFEHGTNANNVDGFYFYGASGETFNMRRGSRDYYNAANNWVGTTHSLITAFYTNQPPTIGVRIYHNGNLVNVTYSNQGTLTNTNVTNTMYVMSRADTLKLGNGYMQELIFFNSDRETERTTITDDIKNYFGL